MSLIICPECGKENVSNSAEACPNCGYNIKYHFEKLEEEQKIDLEVEENSNDKYWAFKGVAAMLFMVLCSCALGFLINSRCELANCDGKAVENGAYCERHTCTTAGCFARKDAGGNVCDACHKENVKKITEDNIIQKLEDELIEKYGEDIFQDEVKMPECKMSGCDEEGTGTYGSKWYCSKHLYEMKGYGSIIAK